MARRGVGKNGLPKTWAFGQFNIAANARFEDARLGPRSRAATALVEILLQVTDYLLGKFCARFIETKDDSCYFERRINPFGYQGGSLKQLAHAVQSKEVRLKGNKN